MPGSGVVNRPVAGLTMVVTAPTRPWVKTNPYSIVVDGFLDDLRDGIDRLNLSSLSHDERTEIARKLCQITRNLLSTMRPWGEYETGYLRRIASLLERTSLAIVVEDPQSISAKYRNRIADRAQEFQVAISNAT